MSNPPEEHNNNPFRSPQAASAPISSPRGQSFLWRAISYLVVTVVGAVSFYVCCAVSCGVGMSLMEGASPIAPLGLIVMLISVPLSLFVALRLANWLLAKMSE